MRPMLAARQALRLQFDALHVMVLQVVKSHSVCHRLLTVPGVGAVTALTFATAICVVNDSGEIFREGKAETDPEAISTWLKVVDVPIERLGPKLGRCRRGFPRACRPAGCQQSKPGA